MYHKNVLFIVEGKNDEPRFLQQMLLKCYPSSGYCIYSYEANLHMLASRLEKEYSDFENDELDILLFLKSCDDSDSGIFDRNYTDVFMIFDFEPQHPDPHFSTIQKMIRYFDQSDDRGKLFINYPMMQSYRHLKTLPDVDFLTSGLTEKDFSHYKNIVSEESFNSNVYSYDYPVFVSLAYHHLMKLLFVQRGALIIPTQSDYESIDYARVFDIQYSALNQGFVWILNTCILILIDYRPVAFFRQIEKHPSSYKLPV